MTDKEKLDFVIAEIERRLLGDYNSENNEFDIIAQGVCASILYFAKSVQEQPSAQPSKMSVEAAMAELDEKIKAFSEKTKGESAEQILAEMRGEEPAHPVTKTSEQDSELEKEIDSCIVDEAMGFETCARHFANWHREQMMKGAMPRIVKSLDAASYNQCIAHLGLSGDDKVKVIIVKEDSIQ